jgi:hypothetical protein
MAELGEYLRGNASLVTLRLQKVKPIHLHFLSALSDNTTLKTLTLEIFKINNPEFYGQAEHAPGFFDDLPRNHVLQEFNIRGSTYKEYVVHSRYFASLLRLFTNLKALELRSIMFKDPSLTGEAFLAPLLNGLTSLKFSKVTFNDDQVTQIVHTIASVGPQCNLRVLSFGMTPLKPSVVKEITEMLFVNKSLQRLEIDFAMMDLAGLG